MKNILLLCCLLILCSCEELFNPEKQEIIYEFTDGVKVSKAEKTKTADVIKERLETYTRHADVSINSDSNLVVTLPISVDVLAVNKIIENQGKLEFWICARRDELYDLFAFAATIEKGKDLRFDFSNYLENSSDFEGIYRVRAADTIRLNKFLTLAKTNEMLKEKLNSIKFLYGLPDNNQVFLYAVFNNAGRGAIVNESHVDKAYQKYNSINRPTVSLEFDEEGAVAWESMTGIAYKERRQIAIAVNDNVYSAPTVYSGAITGGKSEISGNFSLDEARSLAVVLNSKARIPKLKLKKINKLENNR